MTQRFGKAGARRVLIVDDDPDLVDRVAQLLEDDYEVFSTTDWGEINKLFFRDGVDLVLMDVQLPVLGGDRLVGVLRAARTQGKRTPIVYFSSSDEEKMQRLVEETGADGYLSKSLRGAEIVREIERYLT
ncbi:MAG: response regulator [Planctomycetes bacterium]|nr:response regulator [Planctomycetota bacterium]